jgi:hypothetical protein
VEVIFLAVHSGMLYILGKLCFFKCFVCRFINGCRHISLSGGRRLQICVVNRNIGLNPNRRFAYTK